MDSTRFLLAIVLTIAVVIITNLLFPPAPQRPPTPPGEAPVPADTGPRAEPPAAARADTPRPERAGPAGAAAQVPETLAPADTVVVESRLYRFGLSTRGAALVSAELLQFASFTRDGPVQLVPPEAPALLGYRVQVGPRLVDLSRLAFQGEPQAQARLEPGRRERTVRFAFQDPESDLSLEVSYTFQPESYVIQVAGRVHAEGETPRLLLDLGPRLGINEADSAEDQRAMAYVINSRREGVRSVALGQVEGERIEEGPLSWVGLKNKYFLLAALSPAAEDGGQFGGVIAREVPGAWAAAELAVPAPVDRDGSFRFQLYVGPQEYERLVALGRGLEEANPYGWRVLRPIIRPLAHVITWALVQLHAALNLAYGWVLILFGVGVRMVLWPLNARAMRSQMKNMELQPRMKEIQEKYKADPQRLQKEMLRLYKEEGFNPLGGCLPMLIPFPVLITLFFVFQSTIEFRGVEFMWLPDLSRRDPFYILPVVLGGSMFLMQWLSSRSMPAANPQMKAMMWFMPAFMVLIFLNLASGLNLYYAAQNLASVPQQIQLTRERQRRLPRAP
ncbi:MAG: membrane protein insertase YidC [Gemmatimonadetes bacterium]|nr:membrane protein insertase YidC [Gemmatimonadota bacterium]